MTVAAGRAGRCPWTSQASALHTRRLPGRPWLHLCDRFWRLRDLSTRVTLVWQFACPLISQYYASCPDQLLELLVQNTSTSTSCLWLTTVPGSCTDVTCLSQGFPRDLLLGNIKSGIDLLLTLLPKKCIDFKILSCWYLPSFSHSDGTI